MHADSLRIFPLNSFGVENEFNYKTYFPVPSNTFEILLDQNNDKTLWFGLELFGDGVLGVNDDNKEINDFHLEQNYPNPFNPTTKIKYSISTSPQSPPYQGGEAKQGWLVQLKVYDVLGKEVAMLVNEYKFVGNYNIEFDGSNLPSGIYFYTLTSGTYKQTRKMIILK